MSKDNNEIETQRQYYAETANFYDAMHMQKQDEHFFSLSLLVGVLDYLQVRSILDIGSGTGRAISYIKKHRPELRIVGIEPVKELREVGYLKGLSQEELIDGDVTKLKFNTGEFDLVCEFAVLHHVRNPEVAVSEMLRVANKAIFISDSNNFGQGSHTSRAIKHLVDFLGLWRLANLIKTRGKGYMVSEEDGLSYSYSVFNNYKQIQRQCKSIHLTNTIDGNFNLYKTASHIALLGVKR